jgi:hypothetical protein
LQVELCGILTYYGSCRTLMGLNMDGTG